ncbi:MAG: DUF493 domain-containing protein [Methylophaga sp.]|nr:DUF493 domain-containing protein [Methylophaga sp.]
MADTTQETLLEFPCEFPIKAMGISSDNFDALVVEIVRKHVSEVPEAAVSSKQSSGSKYTSVTVLIQASSKAQLDAIYQELSSHELVKYVL